MIRIGFFTGKIYYAVDRPKECCQMVNWRGPINSFEPLLKIKRAELKARCQGCNECEESRNGAAQA